MMQTKTILVTGGHGKTGRRVISRLGPPARPASRSTEPPFDWNQPTTWSAALAGTESAYLAYAPDLTMPGAAEIIHSFAQTAVQAGVRRLILLSGRREEAALVAEQAIRESGAEWTILRASWFNQNFNEGLMLDAVRAGHLSFLAQDVTEPFLDADDIADVAVGALTQPGHAGQIYDLTGPRLLTFPEAIAEIAQATGRDIRYQSITREAYAADLAQAGLPPEVVAHIVDLFSGLLDGRNQNLGDGVTRALGRPPRDFRDFAHAAATTGVWT